MKTVRFAGLDVTVNDDGDVEVTTPNGVVYNDTVADALVAVEALKALLRYAAIGENGF